MLQGRAGGRREIQFSRSSVLGNLILASSLAAAIWFLEPLGRTLGQNKVPAKTIAPAAPMKAPVKAPVAQQPDNPFAQILGQLNRMFLSLPGAQQPEDPVVQQFEQQFGRQFRQMYRAELHFMRLVCRPTKGQYEKIAAEGEPVLKATMRKIAMTWRRPVADGQSEPRTPIFEAVARSVRSTLSPKQAARYQKELDLRTAARKRVTVLTFVARIDNLLVLTAEQRAKLCKILENNWQESWNQAQWLTIGNRYFPAMPDDKIMPILTESQKEVWRGTPKGNIRFGFYLPFFQGIEIGDEVWDDDPGSEKAEQTDSNAANNGKGTNPTVEKK
jgi:hypothetical protein